MEKIKINNKSYDISYIDTEDTIKNMVALNEKTFKSYIKFTELNLITGKNKVEFLSKELKNVELKKLKKVIEDLNKKWKIEPNDIALEWLKINKIDEFDTQLLKIFKEIDSVELWSVDSINKASQTYSKKLQLELENIEKNVKEEQKYRNEYKKYKELETTHFIQDSVITEYDLEIDIDPLEAFNNIVLTPDIPFVRLKTQDQVYYKIIDNVIPIEKWLEGDETFIFKIKNDNSKDEWETATLMYNNTIEPYTGILNIETNTTKGKTDEMLKNDIISLFGNTPIKIKERREKGIKGIFAVPKLEIVRDVFLELITNDPMISYYLYIDETRELSSIKSVLYLYYSPLDINVDESDILTVFLSQKTVSRSDPFYTNNELLLFTPYLNVRISRAKTLEQVERFKKMFSIVLNIYLQKFKSIVEEYSKFIPDFKDNNKLETKREDTTDKRLKALQEQDSELFVYGYSRKCEKKKQPIPIDEKDVEEWERKGKQVMNYPEGSMNYFVCPEEDLQYPGLIENKLENSDKYEYLPCCYPQNQRIGNKKWNLYLTGKEKTKRGKTTNIIGKKALTEYDKFGYLPKNIYTVLKGFNKEPNIEFLRYGVPVNNNSFIEAVCLSLDNDYDKSNDKKEYVNDIRNNLAKINLSAIIQQMYNITETEYIQNILNPNVIFDSKLYIGLLEVFFDCQIVVFTRLDEQSNGEFELPMYTQGYLYNKLDPNKKTVLIYKHFGTKSNNLENPHYELIIKRVERSITRYFENDHQIIKNIYSKFLLCYKLFMIGKGRYNAIDMPPVGLEEPIGQIVDVYGKTRGFLFDNPNNGFICIDTSPLNPVLGLDIVKQPIDLPKITDVKEFLESRKIKIISQDVENNSVIGLLIEIPNVIYSYIKVKKAKILPDVAIQSNLGYSESRDNDIIQQTVNNRKIADFLMQNILYKFSIWYNDSDEDMKKQNFKTIVKQFMKTQVITNPEYDYSLKSINRKLSLNSNFYKKDKLIVDSPETKKRLGYYLNFMIDKNKKIVLNYKNNIYLDNFYTYSIDFKQTNGQLIFIGGLSITNWIKSLTQGISTQIHLIPHANIFEPLFFSNWALNSGKPVIIQNVVYGSLKKAFSVSKYYLDNGVNMGYNFELDIDTLDKYTEYFFVDGVLTKQGIGKIKVWRYTDDYYAAILIP
jgi:hypothetical protein